MGRLIIDGNSVYEIDEDCIKQGGIPKECQIHEYLQESEKEKNKKLVNRKEV